MARKTSGELAVPTPEGRIFPRRSARLQRHTPLEPTTSALETPTAKKGSRHGEPAVVERLVLPPTPESLPRLAPSGRRTRQRRRTIKDEVDSVLPHPHSPPLTPLVDRSPAQHDTALVLLDGQQEVIGKIHLAQERVRHDPWKLLVCTCLMNKTSGRAARPVFNQILDRWPTPSALSQATPADLSEILYPIGLFNQRAASLIRMSQQYLTWGWPLLPPETSPLTSAYTCEAPAPEVLDVNVFYGAGRYASDSFRIYSDLLPGQGAPRDEAKWLEKRHRALSRLPKRRRGTEGDEPSLQVKAVSEFVSDDEGDDSADEWRTVRPNGEFYP